MTKKSTIEVIEYTRDKKIAAKDELILDGEAVETPASNKPAPQEQREFTWRDPHDVIVENQPAIACYIDQTGCIVIRQEDFYGDEYGEAVYFRPEHAE